MIGEKLVENGLITQEQLKAALEEQKRTGVKLGDILLHRGFITEKSFFSLLAKESGIEHVNLEDYFIEASTLKLVPASFAQEYKLIPLVVEGENLLVAMANIFDIEATDIIQGKTNFQIRVVSATESDIIRTIDRYYKTGEEGEEFEELVKKSLEQVKGGIRVEESPAIVDLVNRILIKAAMEKATDIHLEPRETTLEVRQRIDGFLRHNCSLPRDLTLAILNRIKIMGNLDISERRIPQDGKISFFWGKKIIDIRISTFPFNFGEKAVLRLLNKEDLILGFEQLGFADKNLKKFLEILSKSQGIILIAGPTGSGKTTTLYSAISHIYNPNKNIVTLEDPIEYDLQGINQGQVNPKVGLTFATGLRSILRQDPDIILVGEMRDTETAELAIRAALTGHLVFSTIHANDAASTISRLRDMGGIPSLMASAIVAVIAQRLVRIICDKCKEEIVPSGDLLKRIGIVELKNNFKFYKGKGCYKCGNTGYKGRMGIFEIMPVTHSIAELIMKGETDRQTLQIEARKKGMKTMLEDGFQKTLKGITTLEEVVRVVI